MEPDMTKKTPPTADPVMDSIRSLVKAGLELGVPEALRKASQLAPFLGDLAKQAEAKAPEVTQGVQDFVTAIKEDPQSILQLAKEVWSRGGKKEKEAAATAVGKGIGALVPHRALQAARELATMARDGGEADLVGRKAIEPLMDQAPAMFERVKQLLSENQKLIRQAAIAGLVAYVGRKRKYVALGAEILLLVAEEHEKEIRDAVKWGMRQLMSIDPKTTAKAVVTWVKQNPTTDRVQAAAHYVQKLASDVAKSVEKSVTGAVGFLTSAGRKASQNGAHTPGTPAKKGAKPKGTRAPAKRKSGASKRSTRRKS